jgi:hypothetical protein
LQEYTRALLVNGHEGAGWNVEYNEFYRNYIHNFNITSQLGGRYNRFYYNIWDTVRQSPVRDAFSSYAAGFFNYTGARADVFANNLIMNCAAPGLMIGSNTSTHIDSLIIINNLFYNCGTNPSGRPDLQNVAIWIEALANAPYLQIANNLIYSPASPNTIVWGGYGTSPIAAPQFDGLDGTFSRTIQNTRFGDPRIGFDHRITSGSDAIDHGINFNLGGTWDGTDYWGDPVPSNGVTDIGVHEWSSGSGSQLQPPSLTSPPPGATDQSTTLVLRWNPVNGATGYELLVATDPQFASIVLQDASLTGPSRSVGPLQPGTQYFWRVRAKAGSVLSPFSTIFSFITAVPVPGAVTLNAPPDGALDQPNTVVLDWNSVTGASTYEVQVSTDPQFTPLFLDDASLVQTSKQVSGLAVNTKYYWRVRAANGSGAGSFSAARSFTTGSGAAVVPATPVPKLPPNGASGVSTTALLAWEGVSGASSYAVQLSVDAQFKTLLVNDTSVSNTSRQVPFLSYNATYYWRVAAVNGAGRSPFSPAWTFVTDHPSSQDTTQDITAEATPIALVNSPQGSGERNIEIMRDGVWPPTGNTNPALQYDTYNGQTKTLDWIGYTFAYTRVFTKLVFEEGIRYGNSGGWFNSLKVQVLSSGQWGDVESVASTPSYSPTNGISYTTYEFTFPPVTGEGIRLAGIPAGTGTYISVAELRVFSPGVPSLAIGSFSCSPDTLPTGGGTVTLTWSSIGADSLVIDHGIGRVSANGSLTIPVVASTDFIMTLTNHTGRRNIIASVTVLPPLPRSFALEQNFPNPFNPETRIPFRLPVACNVFIRICNILGQQVAVLVNARFDAGSHTVVFSGKGLASGVYFCEFIAGDYTEVRRLLLVK